MDCIRKHPEPSEELQAKLMLDSAKGLGYLPGNRIFHWDIMLDKVPIFSLSDETEVTVKLTDFCSFWNINTLMTNTKFANSVGSACPGSQWC